MVFSAALHTTTSTGVSQRQPEDEVQLKTYPGRDDNFLAPLAQELGDKHDVVKYTMNNAMMIGGAGLVAGLQEAFYAFDRMPDAETGRTLRQAAKLLGIVGRKTLLGLGLGVAFCYTEASLENLRGKHDMWNGMAGGAAAGLLFSMLPPKPMPQPIAWPLAFAALVAGSDIVSEKIPQQLQGFRHWGPVLGRENLGDPEPPRPPILETGTSGRPVLGNYWRSSSYNTAAPAEQPSHH